MARIYKPTYKDRKGRTQEAAKYAVDFKADENRPRPRRLAAFKDRKASVELGRKLERLVEMRAAGQGPDLELTRR